MRLSYLVLMLAAAGNAATLPIVTAQAPNFPTTVTGGAAVIDTETGYFTVLTPAVVDLDAIISLQTASLTAPTFNGVAESVVDVEFNGSLLYQFFANDNGYTQDGHHVVQGPTQALGQSLQPGLYTVAAESRNGVGTLNPGTWMATQNGTGVASLGLNVVSGDVIPQAPEPGAWLLAGLGSLVVAATALRSRYQRSQGLGC